MKSSIFSYHNLHWFFIAVWLTSVIGFHKTYTSKFPDFEGINWIQHFHGSILMSWYAMLIIQPLLIRFKKNEWHRILGKLSYVLAPLVVYSIFLITQMMYHRDIGKGNDKRLMAHFAIEIPTMVFFSLFFVLAMINRKNSAAHMRYMIGTALLMIGPGLARALIFALGFPPIVVILLIYLVPAAIAFTFLWIDYRNKQNTKPFLTISSVFLLHIIIGMASIGSLWQGFATWFTHSFF